MPSGLSQPPVPGLRAFPSACAHPSLNAWHVSCLSFAFSPESLVRLLAEASSWCSPDSGQESVGSALMEALSDAPSCPRSSDFSPFRIQSQFMALHLGAVPAQ